jgi:hypothetical protein
MQRDEGSSSDCKSSHPVALELKGNQLITRATTRERSDAPGEQIRWGHERQETLCQATKQKVPTQTQRKQQLQGQPQAEEGEKPAVSSPSDRI